MPNWNYTHYAIEGNPIQLQSFENILTKLESRKASIIENGFGKLWVGNILQLLGGDWRKIRCRGRILAHTLEDGILRLYVESAWTELNEAREFFLEKYPDMAVYYQSEEEGLEIFLTNDVHGKYFSSRYIIDSLQDGEEYFDDISEASEYVKSITGIETEATEEGINKTISNWEELNPDNWMSFHVFEIVE